MRGEERRTEGVLSKFSDRRVASSVRSVEELLALLPEEGKFALYSDDVEALKRILEREGVEVVSVLPLIGCVVVRTSRDVVVRLAARDEVREFDVVGKVRALGGGNDS